MKKHIGLLSCFFMITNCYFLHHEKEDSILSLDDQVENIEKKKSDENLEKEISIDIESQISIENIELKQARIWSRLDEIESILIKQKEKINILEKTLLLGLSPDQSSEPQQAEHPNQKILRPTIQSTGLFHREDKTENNINKNNSEQNEINQMKSVYQARMTNAINLFEKEKYGKAYIDFSKILRDFDEEIHNNGPEYWSGRCWFQLQEYQQAKNHLQKYLTKQSDNVHAADAAYWLAKTEISLGMKEKAVNILNNIIKQHPNTASAEAARQLLDNMVKDL